MISQESQLNLFTKDLPKNLSLRTTAKLLKVAPHKFNQLLAERGFIFKSKSTQTWEAHQKSVDLHFLINDEVMIRHNSGELIPHIQVKVTPKGYQLFKQKLLA